MARNQTLLKILNDTRGEARLSLNPAHNRADREAQIGLIQREQERLWADFNWPHLMVDRYIPLEVGRRYYDTRGAYNENWEFKNDLSFDRVISVSVQQDNRWQEVCYGITADDRLAFDAQRNEQSWPVRRWNRSEEDLLEVWPMPDYSAVQPDMYGVLKVTGIRDLRRFTDDDDRADLDDRLLSLYCGGAILAEGKAPDAELKLSAAKKHYDKLRGKQVKNEPFQLFGTGRRYLPRNGYVSRYVRPE